jgi:hypothetical protein
MLSTGEKIGFILGLGFFRHKSFLKVALNFFTLAEVS